MEQIMNEVQDGAIGNIYYYIKTDYEVSEEKKEAMRNKMMADYVHGAITAAMHSPGKAMDVETAMQRGANEATKQVKMMEEGTEMRRELFMIGDPNTPSQLKAIEQTPGFRGWANPILVQNVYDFYNKQNKSDEESNQ